MQKAPKVAFHYQYLLYQCH